MIKRSPGRGNYTLPMPAEATILSPSNKVPGASAGFRHQPILPGRELKRFSRLLIRCEKKWSVLIPHFA